MESPRKSLKLPNLTALELLIRYYAYGAGWLRHEHMSSKSFTDANTFLIQNNLVEKCSQSETGESTEEDTVYLVTEKGKAHLKNLLFLEVENVSVYPAVEYDWSQVPVWINYIAKDSDGNWVGYRGEPRRVHNGWEMDWDPKYSSTMSIVIPPEHSPAWPGDWRFSLAARPVW